MFTIDDTAWDEYTGAAMRMGVARGYQDRQAMIATGGDPDADDAWDGWPGPLSGEYAGEPIPATVARGILVGDDKPDDMEAFERDVADAYEDGYWQAAAGDAVPCKPGRAWITGEPYCAEPGTHCDCPTVIRN